MKKLLAVLIIATLVLGTGAAALASPIGASEEFKAIVSRTDGGEAIRGLPAQVEHAGYDAQAYIESLHPQQGPVIATWSPSPSPASNLWPSAGLDGASWVSGELYVHYLRPKDETQDKALYIVYHVNNLGVRKISISITTDVEGESYDISLGMRTTGQFQYALSPDATSADVELSVTTKPVPVVKGRPASEIVTTILAEHHQSFTQQ